MSYPELLLSGGTENLKRYLGVIENIPPNTFHQYLERLSKVSKAKNLGTLRKELEQGCIEIYDKVEMLSMDMLNVGEYIIAFEPSRFGPAGPTSLMLIIPIERIDVGKPGGGWRGMIRYIQLSWQSNFQVVGKDPSISIFASGKDANSIMDNGWSSRYGREVYIYNSLKSIDYFINWNVDPFNSIK